MTEDLEREAGERSIETAAQLCHHEGFTQAHLTREPYEDHLNKSFTTVKPLLL